MHTQSKNPCSQSYTASYPGRLSPHGNSLGMRLRVTVALSPQERVQIQTKHGNIEWINLYAWRSWGTIQRDKLTGADDGNIRRVGAGRVAATKSRTVQQIGLVPQTLESSQPHHPQSCSIVSSLYLDHLTCVDTTQYRGGSRNFERGRTCAGGGGGGEELALHSLPLDPCLQYYFHNYTLYP